MQDTSKGSAIVTGGASGIGRALCEQLARRGVEVVVADRQVGLGREVVESIRSAGGSAVLAELDVRDFDRFASVVDETIERSGRLDYLVNNAGIAVGGEIKDYDLADWYDVLDVNLKGVAHGVQAAYPRMIAQGFGHVVNVASMAGLVTSPFQGSYTTTKHAVVGMSKALRVEAARHGVKVSVVCPGVIRTPILEGGVYGRLNAPMDIDKVREGWERLRPMAPRVFARRVLEALDRNEAIIVIPRWWKHVWRLERLSPRLAIKVTESVVRQLQRKHDAGSS